MLRQGNRGETNWNNIIYFPRYTLYALRCEGTIYDNESSLSPGEGCAVRDRTIFNEDVFDEPDHHTRTVFSVFDSFLPSPPLAHSISMFFVCCIAYVVPPTWYVYAPNVFDISNANSVFIKKLPSRKGGGGFRVRNAHTAGNRLVYKLCTRRWYARRAKDGCVPERPNRK